jgi:CheY-like chemotaxis protein
MGGRVWVESEIGKGSTFHFTARFGVAPGAADATARIDLGGVRVLIMDGNATCRTTARDIFETHGATVAEAASADEAAEAVAQANRAAEPFDLVFADCSRADAGGFELARRIGAKAGAAAGLTVATVSSYDLSKAFVGLREAGLEHYVVKPLKRADLLAAAADFSKRALETPQFATPAAASNTAAIGESAALSSDNAAATPVQALLMLAGDEAAAAPCRILLADDSIDNRLLIRAYLGKTGYGLDEAENGQVAVDKLTSGRYDLVLMDIQMPVMDGFTAVRRIRQLEREHNSRHTPIIALTASTFDETVRKALEAGCDSHLGKPLKRSTLLRVIRETALSERPDKPASAAA